LCFVTKIGFYCVCKTLMCLTERSFVSAEVGSSVTLQCSYGTEAARYYWYKQSLGQKLQIISISYKFAESGTFHDEFKDNPRFTVENIDGKSQLSISDLKPSDTGTYFCASGISFVFEFGEGATVSAVSLSLVYFLSAALIFTVILSVLLAFTLHKMHKRNCCQTSGYFLFCYQVHQDAGDLHYAAVNANQLSRSRRHRKSSECVYSAMTQ
uniref:Ig-like domain-containing protein n=1 Tax=Xiphophorus maculatus TaxID=8083 RepID=A0A3B5Q229_XIPMA